MALKHASIYKIAEIAKVSIGTVDRALKGRPGIREATRLRVLRIAKQLDYTPHPAARALALGRSTLRIGVCIPEEIHFFYDQMRAGIFDEVKLVGGWGIDIVYRPVPALGRSERRELATLLANKVNAIVLTPGSPKVVTPLIDRAERSNVRVVCITTDAPHSRRSSLVSIDPELSGRLAAELMAKFLPPNSETAVITGMLATEEHQRKVEGFCAAFEGDCPGGSVVAVVEAHESEKESYRKTSALIARRQNLRGIYVSTVNCLPVCRALHDSKLTGRVRLITTDLFQEMIPRLEDGTIAASIYQNPYLQGQMAVRSLVDYFINGAPLQPMCYLSPAVILRTNVNLFREASANGIKPVAAEAKAKLKGAAI
jgi:LacI family transcriptional regulator